MKLNLNIATKIGLGFGILTIAVIANSVFTSRALNKSIQVNQNITTVFEPSESNLSELQNILGESKMLIRSWVFIDKKKDAADKIRLVELHEKDFPRITSNISPLLPKWEKKEQDEYLRIYKTIKDTLFVKHQFVMKRLNSFESYDDPLTVFEVIPMVTEGGEIITLTDSVMKQLDHLVKTQAKIVSTAREQNNKMFTNFQQFIFITGLILAIVAILVSAITIQSLVRPIYYIKKILLKMAKGVLPSEKIREGSDEIGQMSLALNSLIRGLKDISNFAIEIGKGNFNASFQPLSEEDVLGNSLVSMREDLKKAEEEETKRKKEDEHRNWATQGVARFSDLLRKDNDDMETLAYNIISNLVKYVDANQGGLFIINDNDKSHPVIEMMACYAYDRKKYTQKVIEFGEGLIGRCIQENETIYMTEIPDNYIQITSGLGDANPRCLLLVPLKLNDEIYGVMEIASFNNIEPYQTEFIEKIGESIASTIATVKINIRTQELLEQSRQQAEEMSAQEEEMRQNLEELRATQEQSERREEELRHALAELQMLHKTN
jgi:hypothetical protein